MNRSRQLNPLPARRLILLALLALVLQNASCARPASQQFQVIENGEPTYLTRVYFYPMRGQSPAQQERDHYECYLWAVKQSGFDPSKSQLAPHQQVVVVPQPPAGQDTAAGAVTGALIGAVAGAPHHSAEGAALGAIAGAMVGAATEASRQQQTEVLQQRYEREGARQNSAFERKARNYRRAIKACLEGRGYSVQ